MEIDKVKELINAHKNDEAINILNNFKMIIESYADSYSKNQNIKKESIKRNERIKVIDKEIESWKNLLNNSEKMSIELNERKNKQNLKLGELEKQPQTQAEKKGQISENLRISENEKNENEILIEQIENKIINLRNELNTTKENSIEIKKDIIEHLWNVVISDNTVDQYESNLMRRICGLIYFPDKECAEIKLKLMNKK